MTNLAEGRFVATARPMVGLTTQAGRIKKYIDGTEDGYASRSIITREVFSGHAASKDLAAWIDELVATGEYVRESLATTGRPKEVVRRKTPRTSDGDMTQGEWDARDGWCWDVIYGSAGGEWLKLTGNTADVRMPGFLDVDFLKPERTVRLALVGHSEAILTSLHGKVCDGRPDLAGEPAVWQVLAQRTGVEAELLRQHHDGFVRNGFDPEPLPDRAWPGLVKAWHQTEAIRSLIDNQAAGHRRPAAPPTVLYFWYDEADRLLYIGITGDLATRQTRHAKRSSWAEFADHSTTQRFPTRAAAEAAEVEAIKALHPLFNHQHNDTPEARARLVAYLIEHGRADLLTPAVSRG
jgi:predicted GIY-YIG superfamily endonuclease